MVFIWVVESASGEERHYIQFFSRGTAYPINRDLFNKIHADCNCKSVAKSELEGVELADAKATIYKSRNEELELLMKHASTGRCVIHCVFQKVTRLSP